MNADELRRPLGFLGERGDRQGRRIGPEHHAGADRGLGPGDGLGLDGAVLEHRFDHEIAAAELAVIGGRLDAGKQRVAIRGADAALGDLVADQLLGIGLAFFRGLLIAIDQHDLDTRLGGHIGDARAHETGADDADAVELGFSHMRRPTRALVELLHGQKEGTDHRRGLGRAQDLREIARLDAQRQVHGELQALVDALQDGARRRVIVVGLAPVDGVRGRERHHPGLGEHRSARQPEALDVPRRLGLAARLDPVLGGLNEIRGGHDGVDELHRFGAVEPDLISLEQKLQRVGGRQHASKALRAAAAREQPDLDLGQPDAGLGIVRRDPVMTGEAKLEPAAERGAVDGGGPRLAAGFEPPEQEREVADLLEQPRGRRRLAVALGDLAENLVQRFQEAQIGAGAEAVLARGDDRAFDAGIALDPLDDGIELLADLGVDHVHRAAGHVPGDQRDAVGVDVELEIGEGHRELSRSIIARILAFAVRAVRNGAVEYFTPAR